MSSQSPIPASAEAAPTSDVRSRAARSSYLRSSIFYLLPLAGFWLLLIYNLGAQWSIYEQYNYGWAVPFLCAYLVWRKLQAHVVADVSRRNLSAAEISTPTDVGGYVADPTSDLRPPVYAPRLAAPQHREGGSTLHAPLLLLALCLLAYAPTRWLHEANPVWRLTGWLWALEVIAITLLTLRLADRRWERGARSKELGASRLEKSEARHPTSDLSSASAPRSTLHAPVVPWSRSLVVPIVFFLVAVPWPWPVEQFLVQSFTQLNSSATVELLGLLGVPAAQHGNVIEISVGNIGIDEACSGIRSFQATFMISLFLGELYSLTTLRRVVCVLAGFAFSMMFNLGRTLLLVFVASSKGKAAIASWHDPAGVTILVLCFLCLWFLAIRLKHDKRPEIPKPQNPEKVPPSQNAPLSAPRSLLPASLSSISYLLLAWLLVVEAGTELWYRSHERTEIAGQNWSIQIPTGDSAYKIAQVPQGVVSEFKYDVGSDVTWQDASGDRWQLFYFRWLPARSLERRVKVQRAKMHGPDTCLTHAGMTLKSDLGETTISVGNLKLAFHQYAFEADRGLFYVFFAIYEDLTGSEVLANRRIGTANRVRAALAGSRNYGQRFLEVAVWGIEDPKEAEAALTRELEKLIK